MSQQNLASYHLESKYGPLHANALGYELNGHDQYVDLPGQWGGSHWPAITVSAWIRPRVHTGDFQAILSPADTSFIHFQLHNEGTGHIAIYTDQGAVQLPVIPVEPLNLWRHVAVIAKSGESKLLIDGEQYGNTNTKAFNYILPTSGLFIGRGYQNGRHFNGKIAGLQVWQHPLEHETIHQELYRYLAEKPALPPKLPLPEKVGLLSYHGKYASAQADGRLECNRDWLRGWEIFTVEDAGNGKVGLKSYHGKYLSAQPDGSLACDRDWLRGWEMFSVEQSGDKIGLRSYHGHYISAQPDGSITCDRPWLRGWELFTAKKA
ncbi:MAG: hypothetical protein KDC54_15670 [Lewinella sp.]|nr:hypothetical protein [Lewinella sp.]